MGLLVNNNEEENLDSATDFHFPTSSKALIIFTRHPELGKCKTRLASKIGDEKALDIYKKLLKHTASITEKLKVDKFVYYADAIHTGDVWKDHLYTKRLQNGDDLGDRMHHAFSLLFSSGYKEVVIIGTDLFDFSEDDLVTAYEHLNTNDYVVGPAQDGGYYLLGMKKFKAQLFENKKWSSDSVYKDTMNDLKGEQVALMEERNDIDHYEDLEGFEDLENLAVKDK